MNEIDYGNDISEEAEQNKKLNKENSKKYQEEPDRLNKSVKPKNVRFSDKNEEIDHISNPEEHSNIEVIKGKVLSVTEDDEVYKELQFIINEQKEVTHLILKSSEVTNDKIRIERELKSYGSCDFADIHDENLGNILKNDTKIIANEKIVIRAENEKLLFIQDSNNQKFTRTGEEFSKNMNLVERDGKFSLNEDLGPKIDNSKGKENLSKMPIKSSLLKKVQVINSALREKVKLNNDKQSQQSTRILNRERGNHAR